MDAEPDPQQEDELLSVCPAEVLLAALISRDYLPTSYTDTKVKIQKHRELALDWLDWAVCESDMGRALMEARAQAAAARKGDGTIRIGK